MGFERIVLTTNTPIAKTETLNLSLTLCSQHHCVIVEVMGGANDTGVVIGVNNDGGEAFRIDEREAAP
jgi:hypothetical protein